MEIVLLERVNTVVESGCGLADCTAVCAAECSSNTVPNPCPPDNLCPAKSFCLWDRD